MNQSGLRGQLALLRKNELEWLERMDVVAPASTSGMTTSEGEKEEEGMAVDPVDDFQREMHL